MQEFNPEWLKLNAQLQQKKNALRKELNRRGILKRGGNNAYDNYKYFSEAQYKLLFTELFSVYGLELTVTEESYELFDGTGKQNNGRTVKDRFILTDIDTGFSESGLITGEGLDKGDKAGYKAHTGAMKYYLANTFLVATGDDAECESPDEKTAMNKPKSKADILNEVLSPEQIASTKAYYKVDTLDKLPPMEADKIIERAKQIKKS